MSCHSLQFPFIIQSPHSFSSPHSFPIPQSSNIKQLICTRPIPLTTPPQRTCIYKLLSIIRLAFSPTPISLVSFQSNLSLPVFTPGSSPFSPPRPLSETLFSFSLFLLFPFFPVLLCCNAASFSLPGTAFLCFLLRPADRFCHFLRFPDSPGYCL